MSDALSLDMVLVASGLIRLLNRWMRDNGHDWKVLPHNCNVVSKRDKDAKDVIIKAKAWVERLRTIEAFRPWLEQPDGTGWSASTIQFLKSGFRILSETQNPDAARGNTGHLYMDEFGFYRYESEIWTGALPSIESLPGLRVSIVSTPNGTANQYYRVWTNDQEMYTGYSRHKVDIWEACKQGYPADPEEIKKKKTPDNFAQENECQFLGAQDEYFPIDMLNAAYDDKPPAKGKARVWLGIDVASIVDTTAVTVLTEQDGVVWMGDTYIIGRTPYQTNEDPGRFRLGQEHIVNALVTHLKPDAGRIDVTGDRARTVAGTESLYTLLCNLGVSTKLSPQRITKEFKDDWVSRIKVALQSGKLRFDDSRKDYVYTQRNESEFVGAIKYDRRITDATIHHFMSASWEATGFDFLRGDFQRVYRKWLGPNKTTFDTRREGGSHGDAFWSVVMGYSGLYTTMVSAKRRAAQESNDAEYIEPEYLSYF